MTTYSSGGFTALSVAVADVNGDAKPDLVVANWCTDSSCTASSVGVLLGNGDGTFQTVVTYDSGGIFPNSVVIGDVNGDGKPDLVVVNGSTTGADAGNVGVLLGNGDGTFQPVALYPRGGYGAGSVALADVNGDGKPDVVVANCSTSSIGCAHSDGDVAVLLGKGDGTFPTAVSFGSGGTTPFGVAVGDVNGDGRPDIVAANCSSTNCGQGTGYAGVLIKATFPLHRHLSVRVSGETQVYDCRKEQVGLNDVDQSVIQTQPKSGFASPPGRPHTSNAAPVAGYGSLLRIRWRSKKLDKTSRLVRIQQSDLPIAPRSAESSFLGKSVTSVYPRPAFLQDMVLQVNPK